MPSKGLSSVQACWLLQKVFAHTQSEIHALRSFSGDVPTISSSLDYAGCTLLTSSKWEKSSPHKNTHTTLRCCWPSHLPLTRHVYLCVGKHVRKYTTRVSPVMGDCSRAGLKPAVTMSSTRTRTSTDMIWGKKGLGERGIQPPAACLCVQNDSKRSGHRCLRSTCQEPSRQMLPRRSALSRVGMA